MLQIDEQLRPGDLAIGIDRLFGIATEKFFLLDAAWNPADGTPVFTVEGRYTSQGWTEWTQGFQFGWPLLCFDAIGDPKLFDIARRRILERMAPHVTHTGVHDHGFNNISTYGALRRLMLDGKTEHDAGLLKCYEMALMASGAVQGSRWSLTADGDGYIYSFNGPHSLFSDTVRSLRSLALAHALGHPLMGENDRQISLLDRLVQHLKTTAKYNVYYGEGRDLYDVPGRVVHESIFNTNDGNYRCPSSQQGYSPWTTWTRGHAWIVCGYPEQLEFLETCTDLELEPLGGREVLEGICLRVARVACDYYLTEMPSDGIPYWDTGAPGLAQIGNGRYREEPADPFNDFEPVDSSSAAIACQGFLRLGRYLAARGEEQTARRYHQAGLTILRRLLEEPYLCTDMSHQGLLLHSIYHRPRNWDYIPPGAKSPNGESSLWGDYHLLEAALYVHRLIHQEKYYTFF